MIRPETVAQLADALRTLAEARKTIRLGGNFTKDRIGGPICPADETVSTSAMRRLLKYEPRDLTISVEAGMPWADLERTLAEQRQMLPLDPAFCLEDPGATVGGVIAANQSGPLRRQYGTARDMVIGMTFVTLDGREIRTGGNVVKNVAGLDMGKLMAGSFGTLAAIAAVNFKVFPIPPASRTFVMEFGAAADAFAERDRILRGQLPPAAIDIVNWGPFEQKQAFRLLVRAMGTAAVVERFTREFTHARALDGDEQTALWREIREFTRQFLDANPYGAVVAIPSSLSSMREVAEALNMPFIARAGSGVTYAHYADDPPAVAVRDDAEMMKRVKRMFDPENLLNRGRLYGYL
ncbi:MAG TPA: FAD-binding protein [Bryobacteraceae bacterium]|nr:FAD-binding protein [Bryobacteraceae bacterium]